MGNTDDRARYPIGPYAPPDTIDARQISAWIDEIEALPGTLRSLVAGLSDAELDTPYRVDGWTVRQVVHHLADSHLNSVIRFKWALTEDRPRIKTYFEDRWAELPDYREVPIELSLGLLDSLHARWAAFLRVIPAQDLGREFVHPEWGQVRLDWNIGMYAWHGRHHLAHISGLAERSGWYDDGGGQ